MSDERSDGDDPRLQRLFERDGLPAFALPPALAAAYDGSFGLATPRLYANFVASLDGVVALPGSDESGHVISGDSAADRFVMGLLRACADAVLVGAGNFRHAPGHRWDAATIAPAAATAFAELRARLGLGPRPPLVLVTASGAIDPTQPALDDAWIATTAAGAARLRDRLPAGARLLVLDGPPLRLAPLVERLRDAGLARLLTEGGPTLLAQLVAEGLLDELFLTSAPLLLGRAPDDGRKALVDGISFARTPLALASVRRDGSHLFLRYTLR
jgi:riboflavin biosynthesis pyrimidine reductase